MSLSPVAFILPMQFVREDKSFKYFCLQRVSVIQHRGQADSMNCGPHADRWGLWLIVWRAPRVRLEGNGERKGHRGFWATRSCQLPVRTTSNVFLLHCYLGTGDEVLIGEGQGGFWSHPTQLYRCCCYWQLGAGFQELLTFQQARASRKGRQMRWGLLHSCGVSPADKADVSEAKMVWLKIQMPSTEGV